MYPGYDSDNRVFVLVRVLLWLKKAILWLKKKDFGFSFLLTLATAVALGFFSEYFPQQWESLSSISDPVENVGTMFFSGYAIRGSLSFYLAAFSPLLADFVVFWLLWFIAVRTFRRMRTGREEGLPQA
jgi:hypothetical protein